jgi:hypothetical protein
MLTTTGTMLLLLPLLLLLTPSLNRLFRRFCRR